MVRGESPARARIVVPPSSLRGFERSSRLPTAGAVPAGIRRVPRAPQRMRRYLDAARVVKAGTSAPRRDRDWKGLIALQGPSCGKRRRRRSSGEAVFQRPREVQAVYGPARALFRGCFSLVLEAAKKGGPVLPTARLGSKREFF